MKRPTARKLKKVVIASLIAVLAILIGLLGETIGNDLSGLLTSKGIHPPTIYIVLIISTILTVAFIAYDIWKNDEEKQTKILTEDIEPDVLIFFNSLKERYQKRYESKLDGCYEITLEVSENWDGHKTQTFNERYSKDAKVSKAFPTIKSLLEKKGGVLIIGEPGSGKTVLLLKIVLNLLNDTVLSPKEAIPVIFNLASWSIEYKNFGDWAVSMLNSGYGLSYDFATKLLHEKRVIFLLDGLDELARKQDKAVSIRRRAACLKSLNDYLDGEKSIICSRIDEFTNMQKKTLQDAPVSAKVEILKLTEAELLNVLEYAQIDDDTKHHVSAKNLTELLINEENKDLFKVLCIPFYFTIALNVFYKKLSRAENFPKQAEDFKIHLVEKFVEKKLNRTPNPNKFESEKVRKWLKWLARLMEGKHLITFEFADLQPSDLTKKWKFNLFFCLIFFLLYILIFGLVGGIGYGLVKGITLALIYALFFDLSSSIFISSAVRSLSQTKEKIVTENTISFDFSEFFPLFIFSGLMTGLGFGLMVGWKTGVESGLTIGLASGLSLGLAFGLTMGISEITQIKATSELKNPYQRLMYGFSINLSFFLILLLILSINIFLSGFLLLPIEKNNEEFGVLLLMAFMVAVISKLKISFLPIFIHLILRLCLWFEGSMPLKYATFLDYAAEARILEKDGGFWRFRHQNLQEYFANLKDE